MKHTFRRYQLSEQLFESRNSILYRALSTGEDTKVILKVLNTAYPTPTHITRFRHEHGLMQKLDSPHIPKVSGLIKEETSWAIVMEDIGAGESLDIVLHEKPDFNKNFQRIFDTGTKLPDVDWNPIAGQDNEVEKLMITLQDVTEVHVLQAEEKIQKEECEWMGLIL